MNITKQNYKEYKDRLKYFLKTKAPQTEEEFEEFYNLSKHLLEYELDRFPWRKL